MLIKAGIYPQDLTIHSKEKITIVGAGADKVVLSGRGRWLVFCMWASGRMGQQILRSVASRSTNMEVMRSEFSTEAASRSVSFM